VFVPGGHDGAALEAMGDARAFVAEAYKHAKAIAGVGEGVGLLRAALPEGVKPGNDDRAASHLGVITQLDASGLGAYVEAMSDGTDTVQIITDVQISF